MQPAAGGGTILSMSSVFGSVLDLFWICFGSILVLLKRFLSWVQLPGVGGVHRHICPPEIRPKISPDQPRSEEN